MLFIYLYIFVTGIILGSFYNVVGLRVPIGKSIVKPRSACPKCEHQLTPLELIPVFSYIFQCGKCKNCRVNIPVIYPIMEFLTGVSFCIIFFIFGFSMESIVGFTFVSLFIIITVSDLEYMLIPDKILLFFAVLFIVERLFIPLDPWWNGYLGAIIGFSLLLLIAYISKGGMGGGDIKLFAVIGLVVGLKGVFLSFFLSCIIGTMVGMIGLIVRRVEKGKPFPFGPSICVGTFLSYIYGEEIFVWYLQLFM